MKLVWRWTIKPTKALRTCVRCLPALTFVPPDVGSIRPSCGEHGWTQTHEWTAQLFWAHVRKRTPTSRATRCIWPSVVQHHLMEPTWSMGSSRSFTVITRLCGRSWRVSHKTCSSRKRLYLYKLRPVLSIHQRRCIRDCINALKQRLRHTVELKSWCFFVQCRICLTRNCETLDSWFYYSELCMKCRGIKSRGIICRWD